MIGTKKRFNYPDYGHPDTHPDYSLHRGQVVEITAEALLFEKGADVAYYIKAADGWEGLAWESELEDI